MDGQQRAWNRIWALYTDNVHVDGFGEWRPHETETGVSYTGYFRTRLSNLEAIAVETKDFSEPINVEGDLKTKAVITDVIADLETPGGSTAFLFLMSLDDATQNRRSS